MNNKLYTTPIQQISIPEDNQAYKVGEKGFFIDDMFFEEGQTIVLTNDVEPALNLIPLNNIAKAKKQAMIDRLNKLPRGENALVGTYLSVEEELAQEMTEAPMSSHVLNSTKKAPPTVMNYKKSNDKKKVVSSTEAQAV